jgi:hypothetical protein
MTGIVTSGVVAFSNLTEHEVFNGKSTGNFSLVITMDEQTASGLSDMGVKVKDYKGTPQRKFKSKYHVDVIDLNGEPVQGEVPYGSKVRLLWKAGDANPEYGVATYLNKVRVIEFAEHDGDEDLPDEF